MSRRPGVAITWGFWTIAKRNGNGFHATYRDSAYHARLGSSVRAWCRVRWDADDGSPHARAAIVQRRWPGMPPTSYVNPHSQEPTSPTPAPCRNCVRVIRRVYG